jgi:DNA-directed RNA polymerase specialized sigma24 family protein
MEFQGKGDVTQSRESREIAQGLRDGQEDAWGRLRRIVQNYLSAPRAGSAKPVHRPDREELACDTVSTVWESLARLRRDEALVQFALTVARRLSRQAESTKTRLLPLSMEPPDRSVPIGRRLEVAELSKVIHAAVRDADRELFRLLYVVDADRDTIARRLGVSGAVLRKRRHRLHRKLRQAIQAYDETRAQDGSRLEDGSRPGGGRP